MQNPIIYENLFICQFFKINIYTHFIPEVYICEPLLFYSYSEIVSKSQKNSLVFIRMEYKLICHIKICHIKEPCFKMTVVNRIPDAD